MRKGRRAGNFWRGSWERVSEEKKRGKASREEGHSQKEVPEGAKEEQRRSLSVFGPGMISTLFCVFSVQKVLSFFVIYIAFKTIG